MPYAFSDPASNALAVTFSDSVNITGAPCRALYVGSGGNLSVLVGGNTVVFQGLSAGTILPVSATRVNSTNTTCTAGTIIALY